MADAEQGSTEKIKKKFSKKGWVGVIVIVFLIGAFLPKGSSNQSTTNSSSELATTESADTKTPAPEPEKQEPSIPAEYASALTKATSYANTMDMSKQGVYDQLVSEYGEKFKPAAAKYAIKNVKADWNANALAKAKTYQRDMSMSPAAIRDQLISTYGEKFTESQADYAIKHLSN